MGRATKPPRSPVVYLDACVYFDLLAKNPDPHADTGRPRWESAKAVLDAVNSDRVVLAASSLLQAEVMCLAVVRDGERKNFDRVQGWFTAKSTRWTEVDRRLADDAASLASKWHASRENKKGKFGGADALHLAAAVRLGCDYFLTQDGGFPLGHTVEGVEVLRPTTVWQRDLLDDLG